MGNFISLSDGLYGIVSVLKDIKNVLIDIRQRQRDDVAAPAFSFEEGELTITCATEDAIIHYTTDGSVPTSSSPVYSDAIEVTETTTFKAYAEKLNCNDSKVVEYTAEVEEEED